MLTRFVVPLSALLATILAAPSSPRPLNKDDIKVLQLAHYLENLEFAFYNGGCKTFSDADYQNAQLPVTTENICAIASQEKTHAQTIATVLKSGGVTPLPACSYRFPYTDARSFLALANVITSVGIGAYLGGAELLANDDVLLTTAASILSVEGRHDAYIRDGVGGAPFPAPFDTALTARWAFSLAQPLITSCPKQLPFKAFPALNVTSPAPSPDLTPIPAGTTIQFAWDQSQFPASVDSASPLYIGWVNQVKDPVFSKIKNLGYGTGSVPLPKGIKGAAFAVLTTLHGDTDETELSAHGTLAGPAEIIVS